MLVLVVGAALLPGPPARYDLIVAGGTIVDGSGRAGRHGDVAVREGRIAAIGALPRSQAARVIDAAGLVVAPGFVDVHTHADDIASHPAAENFVRMGVTTVIAGNCGTSALDVADALVRIKDAAPAVNYATLIGHNTVRFAALGTENRLPKPGEIARMKSFVWKAMADGALGFSTGLQYVPGVYAHDPEIIELTRVAANAGGIYASHMRNEGTALEDSIADTIRVGDVTGARVEISHLKVDSPRRWGLSVKALAMIDAARARGVDVEADQYAYTAASSSLSIRFPDWVLEGGQDRVRERLTNPETWRRIKNEMAALLGDRGLPDLSFAVVALYAPDRALTGLSMEEVAARLKGDDSADAQFEAAREMMLAGGASMVYHLMSDEDVDRIMRHPEVAVASDSGVIVPNDGLPHPRGYGNTARVLAEYVRRRHVLTFEAAIRKMTSLPADHYRLAGRGSIKVGYAADLVLIDAQHVDDTATFDKPHAYPAGIPYVIVNGVPVVDAGVQGSARPGQVIARSLIQAK